MSFFGEEIKTANGATYHAPDNWHKNGGREVGETFRTWDAVNYLHTSEAIRGYLAAAIEEDDGDGRLVHSVLDDIARAMVENNLKHKFTISSDELRNILSDEARLSFSTVSHIAHALGMKLIAAEADPPPGEIIYRTIGKEEAQGEILDLLDAEPDLCYDDISDHLRIELEMVVDICIELEDKGVIQANG